MTNRKFGSLTLAGSHAMMAALPKKKAASEMTLREHGQ